MVDEVKSIDIKLYSVSKVEAAFEAAEADDEQPAADVIAAMKPKILEHLAAGKSIAWIISVLQRGGLDLGARQLRTYLQRAGIGVGAKRIAKGSSGGARRSSQKPKGVDAQEGAVQEAGAGNGGTTSEACAANVQNLCSAREAVHAQDVQPTGQDDGGQAVAGMEDTSATGMQSANAKAVQAVSENAGGPSAVQTPQIRKAGRHGAGTGAGGEPANGVQSGPAEAVQDAGQDEDVSITRPVLAFGQSSLTLDDGDDDLV